MAMIVTALLLAGAVLLLLGLRRLRLGWALQVASGLVSHTLCSAAFVCGQDPDQVFRESMRPRRGMGLIAWALRYRVDYARREVRASVAGCFASRAIYRDGLGCTLVWGEPPSAPALDLPPAPPAVSRSALLPAAQPPRLRQALDDAFVEPEQPPYRHTKAAVVWHDGRLLVERYAVGYGADTPLLGYSVTKSVFSALAGILVREGRLALAEPAPIAEWAAPNDPRRAITVEQLLRMSSGLDFIETDSGFDPVTRMLFCERDMAGYAATLPLLASPGTRWGYSSCSTVLLARILRDRLGGRAEDVVRFAARELFEPLGMQRVTLEFDATGTPVGSTYMYAPARDWARFGQLYLDDGMAGTRRILPEGWVRYCTSPTLDSGYGAGFWLCGVPGNMPEGIPWGLPGVPPDTFLGRGFLGQYLVIVPSRRLVVARFGWANAFGADYQGVARLVAEAVALCDAGFTA
jgi:CubicO group peptidase (beta-lactamase class C family)